MTQRDMLIEFSRRKGFTKERRAAFADGAQAIADCDTLRAKLKASQADVKLLREAASILLAVIDSGKIMRPDCYPIVDMKAALTATAPKGEQG